MNLKQRGYCFRVFVIYITTIITLQTGVGEPVRYLTGPSLQGHNNGIKSVLTSGNFVARQTEKQQHLATRRAERLKSYLKSPRPKKNRESLETRPKHTARSKSESSLHHPQMSPSVYSLHKECKKGDVKNIVHGKLLGTDASSDSQAGVIGEPHPLVECGDDAMSLTVPRRWAAQLRVGPVNGSSFTVPQLLPQCGYSTHKSWKDLIIIVKYKGCHVIQESDGFVLPLLWRNAPVRMSCSVFPKKSQALGALSQCCSPFGMTVFIQGPSVAKELNVNVRGEWTPLLELVQHCGYSLDRRNAKLVLYAPFPACGITSKNGKYILFLHIGEETFMLTCPTSPTEEPQQSNPDYQSTITTKMTPETLKRVTWAPPFYLAPPYYPHPTYYHRTVDTTNPLLPATTFPFPPVSRPQPDEQNDHVRQPEDVYSVQASSGDSSHAFPVFTRNPASSISQSPTPAADSSQILPPRHYAFNPYYHYYHHPKIPIPTGPPKAPDPSPLIHVKPPHSREMAGTPPLFDRNSAKSFASYMAARANLGRSQNINYSPLSRRNPYRHKTPVSERGARRVTENRPEMVEKSPLLTSEGSSQNPKVLPYFYYLPYYYNHIRHGPESLLGENNPAPTLQRPPNPVPSSGDMAAGSFSPDYYHRTEAPAESVMDRERESLSFTAALSDLSHGDSGWEEWSSPEAEADYIPEVLYVFPQFSDPDEVADDEMQDHNSAKMDPPFASACGHGTGSGFHCAVSSGCSTFYTKDCTPEEYFVFSLPEFVVEPKVAVPAHHADAEVSCALKRLTSNPYLYFVPLTGCGVRKQMVDSIMVYQLELKTSASDTSLIRIMVECKSYPGFLGALTLYMLDSLPLPDPAPVPVQLRIATDESFGHFHAETHLPLSRLQGRLVYLELSLLQPPDPSVVLLVHYCMAYTLTPYVSTMLIYDSCHSSSDSRLLTSFFSNAQYILVTSFLSQTSLSQSSIQDFDPEVNFFCLTEVCSAADAVCALGCIHSRS